MYVFNILVAADAFYPLDCRIRTTVTCVIDNSFVVFENFCCMVEIFKTNVSNRWQANLLVEQIHSLFSSYRANFDLDDCDRILRVQCAQGDVQPRLLIDFLHEMGFRAEVLN